MTPHVREKPFSGCGPCSERYKQKICNILGETMLKKQDWTSISVKKYRLGHSHTILSIYNDIYSWDRNYAIFVE